jgi:predicted O-methyltransferase YrrM
MSAWGHALDRPFGYFEEAEGRFYRQVAERHVHGIIVEVGVCLGKSLSYILPSCRKLGIHVYAVDLWIPWAELEGQNTIEAFMVNLDRMNARELVTVIQKDSVEAASQFPDTSVDVIHLDTDHTRDRTIREIDAWWPKVKVGGEMLFHDYRLDLWHVKEVVDAKLGKPDEIHRCLASVRKNP